MEGIQSEIAQFERIWGLALPESFIKLYHQTETPEIDDCHFETLEEINAGSLRWKGMLPHFIPFADDADGNVFGLYRNQASDKTYILQYQEEGGGYIPISSGGRLFLERQKLMEIYNTQDEDNIESAPHNERELHEQLLTLDPLSPEVLLYIGASHLADRKYDLARKLFQRAVDSAPWFADTHGMMALLNQIRGNEPLAVESWMKAIKCPIFLSSSLVNYYHAGLKMPEMEMIEWSSERLLSQTVVEIDPVVKSVASCLFNTSARIELASELRKWNQIECEEKELLNALALAVDDAEINTAYDTLIEFYERVGNRAMLQRCVEDRNL
jgi:hypothetical protein